MRRKRRKKKFPLLPSDLAAAAATTFFLPSSQPGACGCLGCCSFFLPQLSWPREKEWEGEKRPGRLGWLGRQREEKRGKRKNTILSKIGGRKCGPDLDKEDWIGDKNDGKVFLDVDLIWGPTLATIGGV